MGTVLAGRAPAESAGSGAAPSACGHDGPARTLRCRTIRRRLGNVRARCPQQPDTKSTVGLGRSLAWNDWARIHGVVDANFKVLRGQADQACFLRLSQELRGEGRQRARWPWLRRQGGVHRPVQAGQPVRRMQLTVGSRALGTSGDAQVAWVPTTSSRNVLRTPGIAGFPPAGSH